MSSRKSRRAEGKHRLPPLRFEGSKPAEPEEPEAPAEREEPEQQDGDPAPPASNRRERRQGSRAGAPTTGPQNTGQADAKPAVNRQPFRHRSR